MQKILCPACKKAGMMVGYIIGTYSSAWTNVITGMPILVCPSCHHKSEVVHVKVDHYKNIFKGTYAVIDDSNAAMYSPLPPPHLPLLPRSWG